MKTILQLLTKALDALILWFGLKKIKAENDTAETEQKKKEEKIETAKDIADNGTLQDLLHVFDKSALALLVAFAIGCKSKTINITTTSQWEGHYYSVEDTLKALSTATLNANQSIWLMSNDTLKAILTNKDK